ncbi:phospholipid carrier-dependent glycosyltransferase [Pontixanthobacter gangjinensis]|nr:phospholipid carrier-dependent glycosyltransferase [Pontixanthobacter gangjinensis]
MFLCLVRLTIPSSPYFDEVHYLPAARALLDGGEWLNREHPLLGKEILALGIASFGDTALGWRIFPLMCGTLALFAAMRALWFATYSRFASLAYGLLLATGFLLFVHTRIAMLDIFMVAFFAVALWQCAAGLREPETAQWRLALAGIAIGLSMASKWNVLVVAMLPGLAFLGARLAASRRRLLLSKRGIPIAGMSLIQAGFLLGLLPLFVYWLTYIPAYFYDDNILEIGGFIQHHQTMLELQQSLKTPHNYQSNWPDWLLNLRAIWYLYEPVDGAQRGVMLIGNPLTMLLGLPAMAWAVWAGTKRRRWDLIAIVSLFAVSLGMWLFVGKPIQFYYHYFLPSCFLLASLAMALDELWQGGNRWMPLSALAGSLGIFACFYPILSASPLDGVAAFETWTWIEGWR